MEVTREPHGRASGTTSGARTTGWEPLICRTPTFIDQYLRWNYFSPTNENQFNRYFGTQGFHDLFKRQPQPRAWQNPFNLIGQWLSGKL